MLWTERKCCAIVVQLLNKLLIDYFPAGEFVVQELEWRCHLAGAAVKDREKGPCVDSVEGLKVFGEGILFEQQTDRIFCSILQHEDHAYIFFIYIKTTTTLLSQALQI